MGFMIKKPYDGPCGGGFTKSEAPVYDHDSKLAKLHVQLAHNAVRGLIHESSGTGNQTSNLRTL